MVMKFSPKAGRLVDELAAGEPMAGSPPNTPGYLAAVLSDAGTAEPGTVTELFVLHDDGCALLAGTGGCDCTPEVTRGFTLWHRTTGGPWKPVATRATERAARAAAHGPGQWRVRPAGRRP